MSPGLIYGCRHEFDGPVRGAAVGNTPLVRLSRALSGRHAAVFVKIESGNPTGSYQDRMAVAVIGRALERGDVQRGQRVVEYTGGNTGTALAFVCARAGLRFAAVWSSAFATTKLDSTAADPVDQARASEAFCVAGLESILDLRTVRRVERTNHLEVRGPPI